MSILIGGESMSKTKYTQRYMEKDKLSMVGWRDNRRTGQRRRYKK